jgi:putative transposase
MPKGLKRWYGGGWLHFITCSCYHRRQFLASTRRKDLFLKILEEVRQKYQFTILGYVVMPEHFHMLVSEPKTGTPSAVMQVLKQRVARKCLPRRRSTDQMKLFALDRPPAFWQKRSYDFNVYSKKKIAEKLNYMHNNPVKRGLVESPEQWAWSSYRSFRFGEKSPVRIDV